MKTITVAFDVDGTLIDNRVATPLANERIRSLLVILAGFKNVKIIVWSGGGELYARQAAAAIGIAKYVDTYADKQYTSCEAIGCAEPKDINGLCGTHHFATDLKPDIAIDDIQGCVLGTFNLIVKEK